MKIIVQNNQTLFDIAMQYMGNASYVAAIAVHNDISVTEDLNTGDELELPTIELSSSEEKITKQFTKSGINPAGLLP